MSWAIRCKICGYRITWTGQFSAKPACPKCYPPRTDSERAALASQLAKAFDQCDTILDLLCKLPPQAHEFVCSIREKVQGMRTWIKENNAITTNMQTALDNMEAGVCRWLPSEDDVPIEELD